MEAKYRINLIIRAGRKGGGNLDYLPLGDFLSEFAVPLHDWKSDLGGFLPVPKGTTLRAEIERTHEWELLVGLTIVGAGLLAKSFCEEFGKALAQKLIKRLFPEGKAEIKTDDQPVVLLAGKDMKSEVKVSEALSVTQMANVSNITIVRVIELK